MSSTTPLPSNSGIVTDNHGQRHIPESTRADGSTRKAIKIRPGYRPAEDVELYKNRTADAFRNRGKGGIPGADALGDDKANPAAAASSASNKNAKRREARKRAKAAADGQPEEEAAAEDGDPASAADGTNEGAGADPKEMAADVDPDVDNKKKIRGLKKKLDQARSLKEKKDGGESLLPEQIAKVIKISELIRELEALGFDSSEDPAKGEDREKDRLDTAPS